MNARPSRMPSHARHALPAPSTPAARQLRDAGLRVTSARVAALRLAPLALAADGAVTSRGLHALAARHGYPFSAAVLRKVLHRLWEAGLLPGAPSLPSRRRQPRPRGTTPEPRHAR